VGEPADGYPGFREVDIGILPSAQHYCLHVLCNKHEQRILVEDYKGVKRGRKPRVVYMKVVANFTGTETVVRRGYVCDHVSAPSYRPYIIWASERDLNTERPEIVHAWVIDTRSGRIAELPASAVRCEQPTAQ
jgi:hypothetical protein